MAPQWPTAWQSWTVRRSRAARWGRTGDDRTVTFSVPKWWRRRSLRARVTMITTVGLAVALVAGAMLLRGTLHASLTRGVDNTARQGGQEVVALINGNQPPPDPLPVVAGTLTIQVLGPGGRVVDASPGADKLVPLLPRAQVAALA